MIDLNEHDENKPINEKSDPYPHVTEEEDDSMIK